MPEVKFLQTQQLHDVVGKLCENIGIFIKNYKYTGSNKVVYGPCEELFEEKIQNFDF